jgi:hypothetical protein
MMEAPQSTSRLLRFSLVFPASLETAVHACMQNLAPPVPDYTLLQGEGHGAVFENASLREQVRGRVVRQMLVMVLPESRLPALVDALGKRIKDPRAQWWTETVVASGGLG